MHSVLWPCCYTSAEQWITIAFLWLTADTKRAQVIYETWQVILIKCRACGCKVAGREQILSRQQAAKRHALLQTRWAGLSGLPQLSCKPGPSSPGGLTGFRWKGEGTPQASRPPHNNKHMTHKQAVLMQSKSHVDHVHLSRNCLLTSYKAWLSVSWATMKSVMDASAPVWFGD